MLNRIPRLLAFALLCLQAAIPWTAHYFVTQDGPAHLYGGVVVGDLLTNSHSPYHAVYAVRHGILPNWSSTIILAALSALAGAGHAEQVFTSGLTVLTFFAFAYTAKRLYPDGHCWSPLGNVLLVTFFFTRGYYNFQLGMALGLFLLGYGIAHLKDLSARHAAILTVGWVALFFTHILPTALWTIAMLVVALWVYAPLLRRRDLTRPLMLAASVLPAILLLAVYCSTIAGGALPPNTLDALRTFPKYLFQVATAGTGLMRYLPAVMLVLLVVSVARWRAADWRSVPGGMLAALFAIFGVYLFLPDAGYTGGGEIKVRVAWAVCFLIGLLSTAKLPPVWRSAVSVVLAVMVVACSLSVIRTNSSASRMSREYDAVFDGVPAGATLVRLRYPIPAASAAAGIPEGLLYLPLLHVDSLAAAERRFIAITDYQAPSGVFPFVFQPRFSKADQWAIWTLDDSSLDGSARLDRLRALFPADAYYLILGEDRSSLDVAGSMAVLESWGKHLVRSAGNPPFARLYH